MSKFHIVIDSMSTVDDKMFEDDSDISVIPYSINDIEGNLTKDNFTNKQKDDILVKIERGLEQKTSFVPNAQLEVVFQDLCKAHDIVIYICASEGYTGQFKSAKLLESKFKNLWVINSLSIASTIESLARSILELSKSNQKITKKHIEDLATKVSNESIIIFSPKDVTGMMNSGRVPNILIKLMKLTKTHPLIKCEEKNKPTGNITRKWDEIWDRIMETTQKIYGKLLNGDEIKYVYLYDSLISSNEIAKVKKRISKFFKIDSKKILIRPTPLPILVYTLRLSVGIGITTNDISKI